MTQKYSTQKHPHVSKAKILFLFKILRFFPLQKVANIFIYGYQEKKEFQPLFQDISSRHT